MKTLRCLPPIVFSFLALSVQAEPKQDCSNALESLGYNLGEYTSKKAGWVSKEKHIFNGTLSCYIGGDKKIHSIEDNGVVIVKDGFFGQEALAKRDELNAERKRKIKKSKREMEAEFEERKRMIKEAFDAKIQKLKQDSEPGSSTTEPVVLEPASTSWEQMAVDSHTKDLDRSQLRNLNQSPPRLLWQTRRPNGLPLPKHSRRLPARNTLISHCRMTRQYRSVAS